MPFLFTHVEYCDMHYVYGYCDGNASAAVNEYRRRYPERRIQSKRVFTRVEQSLRDNGCVPSLALHSEREIVHTINARENILDMVKRSPRLSTRRMASRVGLSRMNVWRTLHEENLYPYHDQRVQHLEPGDHGKRMDLCHWVNAHPELLNAILFTDEASFTRDGINNLRNVHTLPFHAQWSLYVPQFNIQQSHVLPTQCIYVFCVDLRTNSDYFPKQH